MKQFLPLWRSIHVCHEAISERPSLHVLQKARSGGGPKGIQKAAGIRSSAAFFFIGPSQSK